MKTAILDGWCVIGYKQVHYINGLEHKDDGPAVIWQDGSLEWYVNGERHRLDGPAVEEADGKKKWYVEDQEVDIIAVFGYLPSVPLSSQEQMILRLST